MDQTRIDDISGSTVRLDVYADEVQSGVATGFMYRKGSNKYLVTNWHVLAGRDSLRPQESKTGRFSTSIVARFLKKIGDNVINFQESVNYTIPLNDSNGSGLGWYHHPILKNRCDVAVIPIEPPEEAGYVFLNDAKFFERFILHIGDSIFAVGFPWGLGGASDILPIWKSGSVASIPGLGYAGKRCFLIDCRTYKGMSGGPVICHHAVNLMTNRIHNYVRESDPIAGTIRYFCGVYSGRALIKQADREVETDLGYVWRAELINEIIEASARGSAMDWAC